MTTVRVVMLLTATVCLGFGGSLEAETVGLNPPNEADALIAQVNARAESRFLTRRMRMTLSDAKGREIRREVLVHRAREGDVTRSLLIYEAPRNVRGTSFLTHDFSEMDDQQWLYLPALRRVRRISPGARGDQFLGTDFTYEDIKKENKIEVADYHFTLLESDAETAVVQGVPRSEDIADALGYGKVEWHIDVARKISVFSRYWDVNLNPLKEIRQLELEESGDFVTPSKTVARNLISGHSTTLEMTAIEYPQELDAKLFVSSALRTRR